MKTQTAILCFLCLVVISGVVVAAPLDRFKGAAYDGYAESAVLNVEPDGGDYNARFKGSSYDGYAENTLLDVSPSVAGGAVIIVR